MKLPKAKADNIVVQDLKDETLIYNLTTNQAFCLNETSAKVFEYCDGETTFNELKDKHQLTDEIIFLALDGLKKENLIADEYVSPFAGMPRRQVIRKVGLASMIALPVISSLVTPSAAHAQSSPQTACTDTSQCPAGQVCNTATGACQQGADCSQSVACPDGQVCLAAPNGNVCVTP